MEKMTDFRDLRQKKYKMGLVYLVMPERRCSKNDRDMSKGHRSQLEGDPIYQIWDKLI